MCKKELASGGRQPTGSFKHHVLITCLCADLDYSVSYVLVVSVVVTLVYDGLLFLFARKKPGNNSMENQMI